MLRKLYWYLFVADLNSAAVLKTEGKNLKGRSVCTDVSRLILVTYTLLIFNSLLPLAADLLAHTFWRSEHLATVHRVSGKDHLKTDMVKLSKESEKSDSSPYKAFDIVSHLLPVNTSHLALLSSIKINYPLLRAANLLSYFPKHYKPPRSKNS